jgi:hypothetical protein
VSADERKGVFLVIKSSFGDGTHVDPVWLKLGAVLEAFLKDYLGKSNSALETYYRSLIFTGKGSMPKTLGTDAEGITGEIISLAELSYWIRQNSWLRHYDICTRLWLRPRESGSRS